MTGAEDLPVEAPTGNGGKAIRMAGRAGWALLDQAVSSFTNFALGVLIARSVDAEHFGAFSLAFATYLIIMNVARAIGTQPLVIRFSGVDPDVWRRGSAAATGTMLALGGVAGLLCIAIGAVLGPPAGATFIALGIALPALLVQDAWRFVFFAAGRGRDAVVTDLVWAVSLISVLIVLAGVAPGTPQAVIGWGLSASLAALVGARLSGVTPSPRAFRGWLRDHGDLVYRYAAEVLVGLGAAQVTVYVVGVTAGLAQAGAIRAAAILLGPMHIVLQASHLIAVPEGVRIRRRSRTRFRLAALGLSGGLALVILAWVVVISLLPVEIGRALLGDSWEAAQGVVFPLGLALVAQGVSSGSLVGLRVLADAKSSLRARILDAVFSLIFGVAGALMGGAVGAAWGIAAGEWAGALIFYIAFLRSDRRHRDVATA